MSKVFYKSGEKIVFATGHGKERAISLPFNKKLGLQIIVPNEIDTDSLGTFTGEIERRGTMLETAFAKARLGMNLTGLKLGLASEGSFGLHPLLPFAAADHEVLVFIDDQHGFQVSEQILSEKTNFAHTKLSSFDELDKFLQKAKFPSHAVIARPNISQETKFIYKGLQSVKQLKDAVNHCRELSEDNLALVETDMRAHLNPTRMRILRELAVKLVERLLSHCAKCQTPGFGLIDIERGLKCSLCRLPTLLVKAEIHGCAKCDYQEEKLRKDQPTTADPTYCRFCNP